MRRRQPGAAERGRGGGGYGSSSQASPAGSSCSQQVELSPGPLSGRSAAAAPGSGPASGREHRPGAAAAAEAAAAAHRGSAGPPSGRGPSSGGRKSSQTDPAPVVTRFSIAEALQQRGQQGMARLESPKISLAADGTLGAQRRSGGEAAAAEPSGAQAAGPGSAAQHTQAAAAAAGLAAASQAQASAAAGAAGNLGAFRHSLSRLSLRDGGSSVPLEVEGSPRRGKGGELGSGSGSGDRCGPLREAPGVASGDGAIASGAAALAAGGASSTAPALSACSRTESPLPAASASPPLAPADEHHARGYALRKRGDFSGAVAEYSRALELEPRHFKALFNRAFSYDKVRFVCLARGRAGRRTARAGGRAGGRAGWRAEGMEGSSHLPAPLPAYKWSDLATGAGLRLCAAAAPARGTKSTASPSAGAAGGV